MRNEALSLFLAAIVNAGLFLGLAAANAASKPRPVRDAWTSREVFYAAAPPVRESARRPDEPPPLMAEASAPLAGSESAPAAAAEAAPEALGVRSGLSAFDVSVPDLGAGPPLRLVSGFAGSPDGVIGGVVGGIPGGTGTARPFDMGQVDRGPQRVLSPLPPYPHWARMRGLEGVVVLRIVVGADGAVGEAVVDRVEGDERFGEIARQAVKSWRYEAAVVGGRKVACTLLQRVRFQLVED